MKTAQPIGMVNIIYAYYRDGHTLRETARHFGMSFSGVCYLFKKHGFPRRTQKHAILKTYDTRAETLAMYQDYCDGMTCKQVAAKYHYDDSTIEVRFHRYGLKMFRSPRNRQRGQYT